MERKVLPPVIRYNPNYFKKFYYEDISEELNKFHNATFYYDETNNQRKLSLKKNFLNLCDKNFILGGVVQFEKRFKGNFNSLKVELIKYGLQKNINELKLKYLSQKKDFLKFIDDKRVKIFLRWLIKTNLYIHFLNLNHLYYSIVDIIDEIYQTGTLEENREIKSFFYKLVRENIQDFYDIFLKYNYPNLKKENCYSFFNELIDILNKKFPEDKKTKEFINFFKSGIKNNEFILLTDNEDDTLIDDYEHFYTDPVLIFEDSKFIFDNEETICNKIENRKIILIKNLEDTTLDKNQKFELEDYKRILDKADISFQDSKNNKFIQISDCVVGILGKFFEYINITSLEEIKKTDYLNIEGIALLIELLDKSVNYSELLLKNIQADLEVEKLFFLRSKFDIYNFLKYILRS